MALDMMRGFSCVADPFSADDERTSPFAFWFMEHAVQGGPMWTSKYAVHSHVM
jgi:hypothetical protein